MHRVIPHLSDLPPKLRTAINQAIYSDTLIPEKSKIFQGFNSCTPEQVQLVIIKHPTAPIPADLPKVPMWILNYPMTQVKGNPDAHKGLGWEQTLSDCFKLLGNLFRYRVYMLVGEAAQDFKQVINPKYNLIIDSVQTLPTPVDLTAEILEYLERTDAKRKETHT